MSGQSISNPFVVAAPVVAGSAGPPPAPQVVPFASQPYTTSSGPGTITYIVGICLMVTVALCLAVLACLLRRKHRRNQAVLAAERESRLASLQEAESVELARMASRGLHPYKTPVVVLQPNGEATLAEQLSSQQQQEDGQVHAAAAGWPPPPLPASFQPLPSHQQAPAQPSPLQPHFQQQAQWQLSPFQSPSQQQQQPSALEMQQHVLLQQQQAALASAAAAGAAVTAATSRPASALQHAASRPQS